MTKEEINIAAFLKFIRFAEHKRDDDEVYFLLYGGKQCFTDISKHPNKAIFAWGQTSTAAGAYQILYGTWKEAKDTGVVTDFSKAAQDAIALYKLKTRKALPFVKTGEFEKAVPLLRSEWTSMPGAAQSSISIGDARKQFNQYVAEFSQQ